VRELADAGFKVVATEGTADALESHGIEVRRIRKVHEGHVHTVDLIESGEVQMVMNTTGPEPQAVADSFSMRRAALLRGIPYFTTLAAMRAAAGAVRAIRAESIGVRSLQEVHARVSGTGASV